MVTQRDEQTSRDVSSEQSFGVTGTTQVPPVMSSLTNSNSVANANVANASVNDNANVATNTNTSASSVATSQSQVDDTSQTESENIVGVEGSIADDLVFTEQAANKVQQLLQEEDNPDLKLRVFITGGGCSGFQYGFTFDDEIAEEDFQIDKWGVSILIDSMSFQYLIGAEIDYVEKLEGSQFVIRNPNVTSTCGCGSSFAV